MKRTFIRLAACATLCATMISCTDSLPHKVDFYHWKTTYEVGTIAKEYMGKLQSENIYLHVDTISDSKTPKYHRFCKLYIFAFLFLFYYPLFFPFNRWYVIHFTKLFTIKRFYKNIATIYCHNLEDFFVVPVLLLLDSQRI